MDARGAHRRSIGLAHFIQRLLDALLQQSNLRLIQSGAPCRIGRLAQETALAFGLGSH
jgi:hypothetical protein